MHVISCAITAFLVCSVSEHSSWAQVTTAKPLASNNKKPDKKNAEKKKPLPALSDSLTGLAKAEYEAGKLLYKDGDFANALVKYQRAFELAKDHRLLYNIAACQKNLRDYSRALDTLTQFRAQGQDKLSAAEIASTDELEKVLLTFVSTVNVLVSEADSTIYLDDQVVGTSPLAAPLRVNVGARKFRFEKPGFKSFALEKSIEGGTEVTVSAKIEKEWHRGTIIVEAGPKDMIALDGKAVGLGRHEAVLASGGHMLRVTAPGKVAFQSEVVVQDNETRRIPVTLNAVPTPPDTSKWFWIGGGAALAIGAIIGGAVMFTPTQAPAAQGTLGTFPLTFGAK